MYSSTFSRKLVNTFSGRCCSLWGRRRDVAVKCWGSSHFQRSLSLHSSSHSGGCRAAFKEPCFKAPRRLRGLKGVPGSVGISLRNCRCVTLGKGALSWRKKSPPPCVAGRYWSQKSLTVASSCAANPRLSQPLAAESLPSFALFPINGVNSSASVPQLCEEDNTQREKSVQYCFIFMPHPDRKISSIHCDTWVV